MSQGLAELRQEFCVVSPELPELRVAPVAENQGNSHAGTTSSARIDEQCWLPSYADCALLLPLLRLIRGSVSEHSLVEG